MATGTQLNDESKRTAKVSNAYSRTVTLANQTPFLFSAVGFGA